LQLNVLELFIDCLTEPNERLVEFGMGGICNSSVGNSSDCILSDIIISACLIVYLIGKKFNFFADPANSAIVTQFGGIPPIIQCLSSPVRNTVRISACFFDIVSLCWLLRCRPCRSRGIAKTLTSRFSKFPLAFPPLSLSFQA